MNVLTAEWVEKAERDFQTASFLLTLICESWTVTQSVCVIRALKSHWRWGRRLWPPLAASAL